jgi:hypothetical protein
MSETSGARLTGGCQCGAVRYLVDDGAPRGVLCHCRMCQKAGGGPFMAFAAAPADRVVFTRGAASTFRSSDGVERGFCQACGTPLTFRRVGADALGVTLGSLDEPGALAPAFQLALESRVGWLAPALALPGTPMEDWLARRGVTRIESRQHPDYDT